MASPGTAASRPATPLPLSRANESARRIERVVVVTDDSVESGGASGIALASIRLLRQRGVNVTVLTGDAGVNSELEELGVTIVPLGGNHIMKGPRGLSAVRALYDPATNAGVKRWIVANDTAHTVYHLHNWHKVLSPSVFSALQIVASRLVMSAHDYFLACPNGGYLHYPRQTACELTPLGVRCLSTSCDRRHYVHKIWRVARQYTRQALFDMASTDATVLAVHEGMVPLLARGGVPAGKIAVLRNPVTPWAGQRVPAERNARVFFVGRVDEDKGVGLVAAAARQAGVPLYVVGDGPLKAKLAQQYPEFEWLGWRGRAEIAALIQTARMVVVPTRWRETFGLVALEAVMSGIPIVASAFALIADEIVDRGFGIACDPHDSDALVGAIKRLATDHEALEQMSRCGFEEARALAPAPEAWCDALLGIYESKLAAA
jgi:glycosyltransferase involved in cell wall biosynthesis